MESPRSLLASLLVLLMACSSAASTEQSPRPPEGPDSGTDAGLPPHVPAVFGKCPKYYATECAQIDVPLDHANEGGESIKIHIARQKASVPAKRQLWLLSGGPGQAGDSWFQFVKRLAPVL